METFQNPFSLKDKIILVTGASSGIGRATAIECSRCGAQLILLGRNKDRLKETLLACESGNHMMIQCDLLDLESIGEHLKDIPELNGVVHSAGINPKSLIKKISKTKIDNIFHTNYYAPALITQHLLKSKKLKKESSIVFISSISTSFATISNSLYASTKSAINSFMRCLALEIAPRGMRANVIQPGMIETPIIKSYTMSEELENFNQSIPLGHMGDPKDVAYACIYLLSDASKFVTGACLTIDGGITLR